MYNVPILYLNDTIHLRACSFYYCYNRSPLNDKITSVKVTFDNENILKNNWLAGKPLKLIVHGWCHSIGNQPKLFCIKDGKY